MNLGEIPEGQFLDRFKVGFKDRYQEGREDQRQAFYEARALQGKDAEGTRIATTVGTNPTFTTARDLTNTSDPIHRGMRESMGMALSPDLTTRLGQVTGTIANDLTQDHSRGLWWLLNAPQATANVINEVALANANPELFEHNDSGIRAPRMEVNERGEYAPKRYKKLEETKKNRENYDAALAAGLINKEGQRRKGVSLGKEGTYTKRKYAPGDVAALAIPSGIAINAGIGLLNPLGGSGGYAAALPSDEDPAKTSNPIFEVAAKYILGKTGNLLPFDEFSEHRPDVSREDYNRYKAFKYEKDTDLNIFDDGQVTAPTGVAKFTMDGIHGPEAQFLGRSLPVTTTLIPFLGAVAGGARGVRTKRPIKGGIIGGMTGLAVGGAAGMITEEFRRRAASTANDQLNQPEY